MEATKDSTEANLGAGIDLDNLSSGKRPTVLVVDDDPDMVTLLKQILLKEGFNVMGALGGQEALDKVVKKQPDIVLLDIMMPDMDGWDTMKHIREMVDLPVIFISALGTKDQVVKGLRRGGDDYITKPFYKPEVVERVRAVLRRAGKKIKLNRLVFPKIGLVLDMGAHHIVLNDNIMHLPPKEFAFLSLLAKNAPAVVNYKTIGEEIWNTNVPSIRKRTNYMVYLLRRKFAEVVPGTELLANVDRVGYKLVIDVRE